MVYVEMQTSARISSCSLSCGGWRNVHLSGTLSVSDVSAECNDRRCSVVLNKGKTAEGRQCIRMWALSKHNCM
jgi:hypothetical protein